MARETRKTSRDLTDSLANLSHEMTLYDQAPNLQVNHQMKTPRAAPDLPQNNISF
jgi:hypothetical protein